MAQACCHSSKQVVGLAVALAASSLFAPARAQDSVSGVPAGHGMSSNGAVVALPESATVVAGISTRAINNVAANDTVVGAPATLGSIGNALVTTVGAWFPGIALNSSTGAIVSNNTVPAGSYSVKYRVCEKAAPTICASATDTIVVIPISIVAVPETGAAVAGVASAPIANIAANDTVNGAAATLGTSGNTTISQLGTWPSGIMLVPTTGEIRTTTAALVGAYALGYQICYRGAPSNCASAIDTITIAQGSNEVQVTTAMMLDIEFDWGRDGLQCVTCNYGNGNARFNWADNNGNLWIGHIDPNSGAFTPPAGRNELADTTAFNARIGNGPEWSFSTQDGQVVSQLVYTRWTPGMPASTANGGAAFATPVPGGWSAAFFPGAIGPTADGGTINTLLPVASQCLTDSVALAEFKNLATPTDAFWEAATSEPGTAPNLLPFGAFASSISGGKLGVRWIPCTHQLLFIGTAPPDGSGNVYKQVFWYDIDTEVVQQLTFDPVDHDEAFMFQAPEFADAYVLATTSSTEIDVYEQTGVTPNGGPTLQLVNQIRSPDPAEPYINAAEPFIHCTPACQTYIFMALQANPGHVSTGYTANGLALTNINPAQPFFRVLAPASATPNIARVDPDYFITANGPYLYYLRVAFTPGTRQSQIQGRYYIDMQLGAPSGPCVGSSAESGLLPGC